MTELIKTRADGSIDTAHYVRRGHMARSIAAHDLVRTVLPKQKSRTGSARQWILSVAILSVAAMTLPFII